MIAIFLSVLAIGIYGWVKIPVSLLPDVDPPEINIEVRKSGYSSEVLERTVISLIRQSVIGSLGLKNVESEATQGFGRVSLSYEFGTNMDLALIEVNEKIDRIISGMPSGIDRPVVKKKKPSDIPVIRIHLSSEIFSITELSQIVRFEISKRFEQIKGVAQIESNGMVQKSIRLVPKSDRIIAANLDLNQISRLINQSNLPISQVLVKDGNYEYLIQIENILRDKASLESLIIENPSGQQIELSELFEIEEAHLRPLSEHVYNGKHGIAIAIYNQPEADLFALQERLLWTLSQLNGEFPSIHFTHSQDQVNLLRDNIDQLYITSGLAAIFAFIVFFVSSKSKRLPLILGTVIPSSILIAIGTLWALDFTLNIITLSGFILGIGLLVDNVIILIEEINQNRASGHSVKVACVISAKNIFPALLSSTLTTVCVFIPLLALDGIASELFKEQAIALIIILGVSLILTFILIPTFYTLWIKDEIRDYEWITSLKKRAHSNSTLGLAIPVIVIVLIGLFAALKLQTEDLPVYDTSDFQFRIVWNETISIEENNSRVERLISDLDVAFISADIGINEITQNGNNYFDQATLYVRAANQPVDEIQQLISSRIAKMYATAAVSFSKSLNPFEMIFYKDQSPAQTRIRKNDGDFFSKPEIESMKLTKAIGTLNADLNATYKIVFAKERIQNSSISYPMLLEHLKNLTDENVITSLKNADQSIPISIASNKGAYFVKVDSSYVDLFNFYEIRDTVEVRTITSDLSGPYISFNSDRLDQAEIFGQELANENGWIYDLRGSLLDSSGNFKKLLLASLLGVLLLYLILVAQFESFIQPLIILSMIPISLFGSLTGLYVTGSTVNVMSVIGIIVMLGIIVNDSILKIDAINRNIKMGFSKREAISKAKDERFKPILMTSLSTVLALFPVMISTGIASDLQKPLATVVISGLIVGTWASISLLPKAYKMLKKN